MLRIREAGDGTLTSATEPPWGPWVREELPRQEGQDLPAALFHHSSLPQMGQSLTWPAYCTAEVTKPGILLKMLTY